MPELGRLLHELIGSQEGIDPRAVEAHVARRRGRRRRSRRISAVLALVVVSTAGLVALSQREMRQPLAVVGGDTADDWSSLGPGPVDGRAFASVVWTGTEVIVWGGEGKSDADVLNTGAAFDPSTGRWRDLPPAPIAGRSGHAAVWTGEEMIVCCGAVEGPAGPIAAYSPGSNSWRLLGELPELESVKYPASVWTGERMVVAGGVAVGPHDAALQLDPVADRWHGIVEFSPVRIERQPDAAWTGDEVVVIPRENTDDPPAAFNPTTSRWRTFPEPPPSLAIDRPSAVWTGDELLLWGVTRDADDSGMHSAIGARLNLEAGEWSPIADSPIGPIDWWNGTPGSNSAIWDADGRRMIVYTGAIGRGTDENALTPVLAYYPDDDTWEKLPGLAAAYHHPALVIAGDRLIISAGSFYALTLSA